LVYATIEDRLPGEQVGLNFQASTEMLDKFMRILEQDGLRFSCDEIVPGLLTICRVEKDRGGLTAAPMVIMIQAAGPRIKRFCYNNQRECGKSFFLHSIWADAAILSPER